MEKILSLDGSAEKKITITASCFMGLSHIVHLKDYVKGMFFALTEVLFIVFSPVIVSKIISLITLGSPQPDLPIKQRSNSIFMLIDGILILAVIALFIVIYVISVKALRNVIENMRKNPILLKASLSASFSKAFPIAGLAPSFILLLVFVVVPLVFHLCSIYKLFSACTYSA